MRERGPKKARIPCRSSQRSRRGAGLAVDGLTVNSEEIGGPVAGELLPAHPVCEAPPSPASLQVLKAALAFRQCRVRFRWLLRRRAVGDGRVVENRP